MISWLQVFTLDFQGKPKTVAKILVFEESCPKKFKPAWISRNVASGTDKLKSTKCLVIELKKIYKLCTPLAILNLENELRIVINPLILEQLSAIEGKRHFNFSRTWLRMFCFYWFHWCTLENKTLHQISRHKRLVKIFLEPILYCLCTSAAVFSFTCY